MIALLDGNCFYVSCQVAFDPGLRGRPVVVLSCNDGAVIARSNEARALGIKMSQPWFQIRHMERSAGLVGLSAQFALYGDMSDRLMTLAAKMGSASETYSIDECFVDLTGLRGDLKARAQATRAEILQSLGLPCCVGIGPTKTLAKLANAIAKSAERSPGSYPAQHAGVCDLSTLSAQETRELLQRTPVGDVWGVGRRIGPQLATAGIHTAWDLSRMDATLARKQWSVMLERTVRELQGVSCIPLEEAPAPRQQIACTRSFGQPLASFEPLAEAVSEFATRAAEKLRRQGSHTTQVLVFVRTSPFRDPENQYSNATCVHLPRPGADTRAIVHAALQGLRAIYRPGYLLAKAGVMLLDLRPEGLVQQELALDEPPGQSESATRLNQAMDLINDRWGKGTIKVGSAALATAPRVWAARQQRLSPAYTTNWDDIPTARA